MFLLMLDFISRGLYKPIQAIDQLAVFVMVVAVYLGIPRAEQERAHVKLDAFISKFPEFYRNLINLIAYIIADLTIIFVLYAAVQNAIKAFVSQEAVAGTVPLLVWPVKAAIVIGCFFFLVQLILNTVEDFKKLKL